MNILIIDDEKYRHDAITQICIDCITAKYTTTHAYNEDQAVEALIECPRFDVVFFDNDLGDGCGEGTNVVTRLLYEFPDKAPRVAIIHTMNSMASQNMASKFKSFGSAHYVIPFCEFDGKGKLGTILSLHQI